MNTHPHIKNAARIHLQLDQWIKGHTNPGRFFSIILFCFIITLAPFSSIRAKSAAVSPDAYNRWAHIIAERARGLRVRDLNKDGWNDVAFLTEAWRLRLWMQNPSCHALEEKIDLPLEPWPRDLEIGDLNADGFLDIVVAGERKPEDFTIPGQVQIIWQSSNGTWQPGPTYPIGIAPKRVAIGDVTSDNRPDILVTSQDALDLLVQQPDGSFNLVVLPNSVVNLDRYTADMVIGDFNGDGRNDVAVEVFNNRKAVLLYLQSSGGGTLLPGTFFPELPPNPMGPYSAGMVGGDVTGDGRKDILVIASNGMPYDEVIVYAQKPGGGFNAPVVIPTYWNPASPNLIDMNNDGRLDLVLMNYNMGSFVVHYQQVGGGLGSYSEPEAAGDIQSTVRQFAFTGDVTGDQAPDIVYMGINDGMVVVTQANQPICPSNLPPHAPNPVFLYGMMGIEETEVIEMEAGDMNGDNLEDFITIIKPYSAGKTFIQVIRQLPGGAFTYGEKIYLGEQEQTSGLSVGDLNGDNRLDIATKDYVIYQNDSGTFNTPIPIIIGPEAQQTFISDWTGDGRFDLASVTDSGISVMAQKEDGTLANPVDYAQGLVASTFLVNMVDWNSDGRMDLAIWSRDPSNVYEPPLHVFLQRAAGGFDRLPGRRVSAPMDVAIGDINSDGRPDILTPYYGGNESRLEIVLQQADGSLGDRVLYSKIGCVPGALTVMDLNLDEHLDILSMCTGYMFSTITQNEEHTLDHAVQHRWLTMNTFYGHTIAKVDTDADDVPDVIAVASPDGYVLLLKLGRGIYMPLLTHQKAGK